MLKLKKIHYFLVFSFLVFYFSTEAQVTGVKYQIKPNYANEQIDAFLIISSGQAKDAIQRIQFNAQFSILVPKGLVPSITNTYMPLNDNKDYKGTKPCKWTQMSNIMSPAISPEYDYYSYVPELNPTSFYNNIKKGDTIRLFTLTLKGAGICLQKIRLFENETDPNADERSMNGANFTNTFTMGGTEHIYQGNVVHTQPIKTEIKKGIIHVKANAKSYQWYSSNNDKILATTTEPMYKPEGKGIYFVKLINDHCELTSENIKYKN